MEFELSEFFSGSEEASQGFVGVHLETFLARSGRGIVEDDEWDPSFQDDRSDGCPVLRAGNRPARESSGQGLPYLRLGVAEVWHTNRAGFLPRSTPAIPTIPVPIEAKGIGPGS